MSVFGLLSLLLFLFLTAGLVYLEYGGNSDLIIAKILFFVMRLLIAVHVCIAIYEFPCYVADGIIFVSMGKTQLANIMFIIVGVIIVFIMGFIIPKINWRKHLSPTPAKLIFLGIVFICLFSYNELFAGAYSFDSYEEFRETRNMYEEADDRFWPTKYIKHTAAMTDEERIALYPLDATSSAGEEIFIYKGETVIVPKDNGEYDIYYYPFTWKLYDGGDPALLYSSDYVPPVSPTDAPVSSADAVQPAPTPTSAAPAP